MLSSNHQILLSVVIVSYNTATLTKQCLLSVIKEVTNSHLLKHKTEIIVVDNASTDDSVIAIGSLISHPQTRVTHNAPSQPKKHKFIQNPTNLGFARANNQALAGARGEYFLLLNSDTLVKPGSLEKLVQNMNWAQSHSRIGLLAGNLLNKDGSVQHQGGALPNLWTLKTHMLLLTKLPILGRWLSSTQNQSALYQNTLSSPHGQLHVQGWVGGAALLIPKEVYQKIGPLDENIFMYGEDTEYCLRAKRAGFLSAIDQSAPITHLGFASSSSSQALIGEMTGLLYIFKKHAPCWQLPLVYRLLIIGCYIRIALFGLIGLDKNKAQTYKRAISELKKRYNND
ncbi:MAG: glycosyltransferase family 2 protein [Patescibacteria group bacterium]|nr:glycosyltransferase family 2 protein [Patescibacteria group bacterium]